MCTISVPKNRFKKFLPIFLFVLDNLQNGWTILIIVSYQVAIYITSDLGYPSIPTRTGTTRVRRVKRNEARAGC